MEYFFFASIFPCLNKMDLGFRYLSVLPNSFHYSLSLPVFYGVLFQRLKQTVEPGILFVYTLHLWHVVSLFKKSKSNFSKTCNIQISSFGLATTCTCISTRQYFFSIVYSKVWIWMINYEAGISFLLFCISKNSHY